MIYIIPTKRGLGVELWGTYDDLKELYDVVGKFWNDEEKYNIKGFENRDTLISGFSYELRHAFQGSRLKKTESHFSFEPCNYLGVQISWVHFLFSLSALRLNMSFAESNKYDLSLFLQMEFWLENSMKSFDPVTSNKLIPFIDGGIYAANECLYQFMRSINAEYFVLGGGKSNFKKLPSLLERAILFSAEYKSYMSHLIKEGKRLKCEPEKLDLSDDDIQYGKIEW
jgi:hypothetical protein